MELQEENIRLLCYFIFESIAIRNNEYDEFPKNLKFVFNLDDINLFEKFIRERKEQNTFTVSKDCTYYIYDYDIENIISILKDNLGEYQNNKNANTYYIYVDNIIKFANLLTKLSNSLNGELDENGYELKYTILNAVWLRMSPKEFDNIYEFLEKQILFAQNTNFNLLPIFNPEYLSDYQIKYKIETTGAWYETNKKICISISNGLRNTLFLPEIYFQILEENNKKICYLYAIQNPKYIDSKRKVLIEKELVDIKKQLRNKFVNYKFILVLDIFVNILRENGILDIKVPLLQLFNYDYHISMSSNAKERFYDIDERVKMGVLSCENFNYIFAKEEFDKVADKEDIISKNKTERLVNTFMLVEERFKNIEILSTPFIEDENLVVKILNKTDSKVLKK